MEEIKILLEENLKLTKEIKETTRYIKRFIVWQQVFSILKVVIFVIPVVLGIIYLPPILAQLMGDYQKIMNIGGVVNPPIDIKSFSPDILNFLKK